MTHADLQSALERMDIAMDAAEAHGLLCGALCTRPAYGAREWLSELADDAAPDLQAEAEAGRLPSWTLEVLSSEGFEFEPLLPGADIPLGERIASLAAWCDGFLFGIGSGAPDPKLAQAGAVGEFLADIADIARVELEPDRMTEAGEGDYAELFEYLRAGVQLTFDELAPARARAQG
jgi:uncharacterized protein YgfB (UPF0149 family)